MTRDEIALAVLPALITTYGTDKVAAKNGAYTLMLTYGDYVDEAFKIADLFLVETSRAWALCLVGKTTDKTTYWLARGTAAAPWVEHESHARHFSTKAEAEARSQRKLPFFNPDEYEVVVEELK